MLPTSAPRESYCSLCKLSASGSSSQALATLPRSILASSKQCTGSARRLSPDHLTSHRDRHATYARLLEASGPHSTRSACPRPQSSLSRISSSPALSRPLLHTMRLGPTWQGLPGPVSTKLYRNCSITINQTLLRAVLHAYLRPASLCGLTTCSRNRQPVSQPRHGRLWAQS